MNERAKALLDARAGLLEAAGVLRAAAAERDAMKVSHQAALEEAVASPAAAESAKLVTDSYMERLRETFEDLAASGLAKTATIEPALDKIREDPAVICDIVRNIGAIALEARKASAESKPAEVPGMLVGKAATSTGRKRGDMSSLYREAELTIQERVDARKR